MHDSPSTGQRIISIIDAVNTRAVVLLCLLLLLVGCSDRDAPNPLDPLGDADNRFEIPLDPEGDEHALNQALRRLLQSKSQGQGLSFYMLPDMRPPGFAATTDLDFTALPADPNNALNFGKFVAGMYLFLETGLAVDNVRPEGSETYSCGSCHPIQASFYSNTAQGIGEGGSGFGVAGEGRIVNPAYDYVGENVPDITDIRVPTVVNSAYQEVVMWDGKFGSTGPNVGTEAQWTPGTPLEANNLGMQGLESQAFAAISVHRFSEDGILGDFPTLGQYVGQFFQAFGTATFNRLNIAKAIAGFERTIVTSEAPFQKWLRGHNDAMTYEEKRGAMLFFGKAGCNTCHTGPALNSMTFHAMGFNDLDGSWNAGAVDLTRFGGTIAPNVRRGRGGFTGVSADDYKFKTPQLYNLKQNTFFGHGSSFSTVREVIEYKNVGTKQNPLVPDIQIAAEFKPLGLSEQDITFLSAFIEDALFDPTLAARYTPNLMPSNNCFPNQDAQSLIDLPAMCDQQLLKFGPDPRRPTLLPGRKRIAQAR
jgi:cytochrome c peroxidase